MKAKMKKETKMMFPRIEVRLPLSNWDSSYPEMAHLFDDAVTELVQQSGIVFSTSSELYLLFTDKYSRRVVKSIFTPDDDNSNLQKIHVMRSLVLAKTHALMPILVLLIKQRHDIVDNPDTWLGNYKMNTNSVGANSTNYGGSDITHHGKTNTQSGSTETVHSTTTNSSTNFRPEYKDVSTPSNLSNSEGGTTETDYGSNRSGSSNIQSNSVGYKNMSKVEALKYYIDTDTANFFDYYFSEIAKILLLDWYV